MRCPLTRPPVSSQLTPCPLCWRHLCTRTRHKSGLANHSLYIQHHLPRAPRNPSACQAVVPLCQMLVRRYRPAHGWLERLLHPGQSPRRLLFRGGDDSGSARGLVRIATINGIANYLARGLVRTAPINGNAPDLSRGIAQTAPITVIANDLARGRRTFRKSGKVIVLRTRACPGWHL